MSVTYAAGLPATCLETALDSDLVDPPVPMALHLFHTRQ